MANLGGSLGKSAGPGQQSDTCPQPGGIAKWVQQTLDLMQNKRTTNSQVIGLAKANFPLDGLIRQVAKFDSIRSLQNVADQKAVAFSNDCWE
jgi:hypothetical protein